MLKIAQMTKIPNDINVSVVKFVLDVRRTRHGANNMNRAGAEDVDTLETERGILPLDLVQRAAHLDQRPLSRRMKDADEKAGGGEEEGVIHGFRFASLRLADASQGSRPQDLSGCAERSARTVPMSGLSVVRRVALARRRGVVHGPVAH